MSTKDYNEKLAKNKLFWKIMKIKIMNKIMSIRGIILFGTKN